MSNTEQLFKEAEHGEANKEKKSKKRHRNYLVGTNKRKRKKKINKFVAQFK